MSKMNLNVFLNGYEDQTATNNPSRNNFRWNREIQGLEITEPTSKSLILQSNASLELFSGSVSTSSDNTTTWNLALKAGSSSTYKISKNSGTSPQFRAQRIHGGDATTVITITKNSTLLTLSSTSGTALDLIVGGVIVGDEVRLGTVFNTLNRGKFKVLSRTATSLTIENASGVAESVTLGVNYSIDLDIFSSTGVQVGDKLDIVDNFSSVSFGTYEITDASPDYIEFYSNKALPAESGVANSLSQSIQIYNNLKNFIYIESDQSLNITVNGSLIPHKLETLMLGTTKVPGIFMTTSSMKSLIITNTSTSSASIFYITAE